MLFGLALFIFSHLSQAIELPQQDSVPGGIAIIQLNATGDVAPRVSYRKKPVMVIKSQQAWYALVGIPLTAKSGTHNISSKHAGNENRYSFQVADKQYESQHITIKNKRKVNPNKNDMKRIGKERKKINAALAHWDDTLYTRTLQLDLPVQGRLSSPFGLRRFFNEQPRKPHSGIDIAAAKGTPITAPASGKIILTGNFFFNGNSAFIDHGQGLITMYCHMDSIKVKDGQLIKQGEQIGTIGMTGRVTGPHLHWSISMNNARIDPNLIVPALRQAAQTDSNTPAM
ncbi:MAG TPA: M23 family metallopeptidase [Candidatus Tenderia electrophaga]|uniref:M23 family metallopeptidase n=1 Tax=Candidatus Tenderia electrophaga TaxID=1748243 RepID=A0A832J2U0_9GAMM|nr:M23 family metallopeptidase [Candidatus Tenderia electrophaga]